MNLELVCQRSLSKYFSVWKQVCQGNCVFVVRDLGLFSFRIQRRDFFQFSKLLLCISKRCFALKTGLHTFCNDIVTFLSWNLSWTKCLTFLFFSWRKFGHCLSLELHSTMDFSSIYGCWMVLSSCRPRISGRRWLGKRALPWRKYTSPPWGPLPDLRLNLTGRCFIGVAGRIILLGCCVLWLTETSQCLKPRRKRTVWRNLIF